MKSRRKVSAFVAFAIAVAGFGLAGCGNSGEGQIKVGASARKSLADDDAAPKKDGATPPKSTDGNLKGRIGGRDEN